MIAQSSVEPLNPGGEVSQGGLKVLEGHVDTKVSE